MLMNVLGVIVHSSLYVLLLTHRWRVDLKIAHASISLEGLIEKSEVHSVIPLANPDNEKQLLGAQIEVLRVLLACLPACLIV